MLRRLALCLLILSPAAPATAQAPLSLPDAIARARARNPETGSVAAGAREAAQRVTQARSGLWPRVDAEESWQRGNQPVFVFGSLLAQRRFTAENFALGGLNHPDPVDNFRTAFTLSQPLIAPSTRADIVAAEIAHQVAMAGQQLVEHELAPRVTSAYGRVLTTASSRASAAAALETAMSDRELVRNRRDAGRVTDADVLLTEVQVSRAREQQIVAAADERIARAELNQLIGEPLDRVFELDATPIAASVDTGRLEILEAEALRNRPEVALASLQERLARAARSAARATFLPQVVAQGGMELNGDAWSGRTSSWVVGATARINLFRGFADRARLAEAEAQIMRRSLERTTIETSARIDVLTALVRLDAAKARESVGRDAVAQAVESRRIVRDRYEAGLADVTSLLRSSETVTQAEAQQTAARVAILTETAALERALGRR